MAEKTGITPLRCDGHSHIFANCATRCQCGERTHPATENGAAPMTVVGQVTLTPPPYTLEPVMVPRHIVMEFCRLGCQIAGAQDGDPLDWPKLIAAIDRLRHSAPISPPSPAETPEPPRQPTVRCSFCGKAKDKVQYLIASPSSAIIWATICNECVALAVEMLDEKSAPTDPLGVATEHVFLTQHEFGPPRAAQPATTDSDLVLGIHLAAEFCDSRGAKHNAQAARAGAKKLEELLNESPPPSPTTPSAPE